MRLCPPLAALCLLAPTLTLAEDWPQWRGPARTGVATETGLAREWPEGGPPVVWSVSNLGEGYGSLAVTGGRVYVQGTEAEESVVFALDVESGRQIFKSALGPMLHQEQGNGPRATPTVDAGVLYAMSGMGDLAAIDSTDGSIKWHFNILDRFGGAKNRYGVSESPLVDGDHLIVMPGGPRATIAALDKRTGETVWTSEDLSDAAGYGSLLRIDVGSVPVIVGFTRAAGVGVRADDGRLLWRYERPANEVANVATPVVAGDLVFYTSSYGVGGGSLRMREDGDSVATEEAYFSSRLQNHHGGVVLVDGKLYSFFGRTLTCADFETGDVVWKARSVGKGSLTAADGLLFLVSENHLVGLAEATPEGYREKGRFPLADHGWPSWAHPVVDSGRLYIRNQNDLTVYDVSARTAGSLE